MLYLAKPNNFTHSFRALSYEPPLSQLKGLDPSLAFNHRPLAECVAWQGVPVRIKRMVTPTGDPEIS